MTAIETRPFELTPAPGRVIRGKLDVPAQSPDSAAPRSLPVVLLLHGFKGFMDWGFFPHVGHALAARGMAVARYNNSGSGVGPDLESFTDDEGFARNTYTKELEDVAAVRAFVESGARAALDPSRVAILGHSRGGGVALIDAAERGDYRALATWSAISTVHRFDDATLARWREEGELGIPNARTGQVHRLALDVLDDAETSRERLDIIGACARIGTPSLVVHGRDDEGVPFAEGEAIAAAFPPGVARLHAVPGTGHTFGVGHPAPASWPATFEDVLEVTARHLAEHLLG
jgi:pimeloyl-ACP methyl ester carboxylesterase